MNALYRRIMQATDRAEGPPCTSWPGAPSCCRGKHVYGPLKPAIRNWHLLAAQWSILCPVRVACGVLTHMGLLPVVQVPGASGHCLDALYAEVVRPAPPQPGHPARCCGIPAAPGRDSGRLQLMVCLGKEAPHFWFPAFMLPPCDVSALTHNSATDPQQSCAASAIWL